MLWLERCLNGSGGNSDDVSRVFAAVVRGDITENTQVELLV